MSEPIAKIRDAFAAKHYVVKNNVFIKGVKCKYAFFYKHSDRPIMFVGVKYTSDKYKKLISWLKEGWNQNTEDIENSWITNALVFDVCSDIGPSSWKTNTKYWRLSIKLPCSIWNKISFWFYYLHPEDDEGFSGFKSGWYTPYPRKVNAILRKEAKKLATYKHYQVADRERRICNMYAKAGRQEAKEDRRIAKLSVKIKERFENAEKPDPKKEQPENAGQFMEGFEKMVVEGEWIEHPFNSEEAFIGANNEWFVIQSKWIWYIHSNPEPLQNNVQTGGAGAMGKRVPYSNELVGMIRKLKEV